MSINVVWTSFDLPDRPPTPTRGFWSYGWLEEVLSHTVTSWHDPNTIYWGNKIEDVPESEGAIVIIPAEYNIENGQVERINDALKRLPWVTLILASDEQGRFPIEKLAPHEDMTVWVMTPHFERHEYPEGTRFLGEYYPPQAREHLKAAGFRETRRYPCSFSGQDTHERRHELVEAMRQAPDYYLNTTAGFTQGLGHEDYYRLIADSIVVPAPSGPVTPDSFRAYETLEAGGVPILDGRCPVEQDGRRYWDAVLGADHPLPVVMDWATLHTHVEAIVEDFPQTNNRVYSWWQLHKRSQRRAILQGPDWRDNEITILMPTSPVPSNPSLDKITQTIESVRFHHPFADILILCDGVRPEQQERKADYEMFLQRLLWKANFEWTNVYPIISRTFQHQANMTRLGLEYVTTDLVLFVEHDIPLVTDMPIDWDGINRLVRSEDIDILKFSFEAMGIHPEHEHMALDREIVNLHGVPVRRTVQWSQRPHVARTDYYRHIIREWFPLSSRTMIEDRLHGVAQDFPDQFRLASYMPEGSKVRCFHIDGRETDEKYDMVYE